MKQEIKIGVQGNDGTGDSIRDAFRKVNENFNEIYGIFGQGRITFSQLADGTSYTENQLITGSLDGSTLSARTLIPGSNIEIITTAESIKINSGTTQLSKDQSPQLTAPFNANFQVIGRIPDPSQTLVDEFNRHWDTQTTFEQLPVSVGYANKTFLGVYNGSIGYKDTDGNIIQPTLTAGSTQLDTSSEFYDPSLSGNYLSTAIVPRKDVVLRSGDTMTGNLYLNDHPGDMQGLVGSNNKTDYQAATAFYVDNKTYTSSVNLYVSTSSGNDLQLQTPIGKEGRYWNYAFKSIRAALLHAESLISVSSQETSPYRQRISYTNGPDHYFSKIQKVALTNGNTDNLGYVAAYNLLQANKEFIQSETIAYINKKYVNSYAYDHATLSTKVNSLLSNISIDLILGATNPDSSTSGTDYNSYWEGISYIHDNPTNEGLLQWLDTVNYIRDQIVDFSYDTIALQSYTNQLIDALAYDLLFKSNYQTIQTAIAFKNAGTGISDTQLLSMITVNPITIKSAVCNGSTVTLQFDSQSTIIFPVGSEIVVNAILTTKTVVSDAVVLTSYANNSIVSYLVIDSSTSFVTFEKGPLPFVVDEYTVQPNSSIDRKSLVNQLLLSSVIKNSPSAVSSITRNLSIISNYLTLGILPEVLFTLPTNPDNKLVTFTDIGDLVTLVNHGFVNTNTVKFSNITSTTGILTNTTYYVVNATTNTFQLSLTSNGSVIPLTTDGSGTVILAGTVVTFTDAGDLVTLNDHRLVNNTTVMFTTVTSTTGILTNTTYYVVNATTNTFQLSTSVSGSPLTLTTNGTGRLKWDSSGYLSAQNLLLENIGFIQAEILSFLSSEYPTVIYDKSLCLRDIKYIVQSLVYDLTYGGNSQSVYAGKQFWKSLTSFIKDSEKTACIAAISHINILAQSIIINLTPEITYQQSVRQYKNDTLINGCVASTSVFNNIQLIASIVTDNANIPAQPVYPSTVISTLPLQLVYTGIKSNQSVYSTGLTTSTSWYMNKFFPVIDTEIKKTKIINLFQVVTDIIRSGSNPSRLPTYPALTVVVNQNISPATIDTSRSALSLLVIDTIANDTNDFIISTYGLTFNDITYNQSKLIQELKNIIISVCYDITFGGTSGCYRASQQFTKISSDVQIITNIFNHVSTLTKSYILDTSVQTLIESKFNSVISFLTVTPIPNVTPVDLTLFTNNDTNEMYSKAVKLKNLIMDNSTSIISNTINYVDTAFTGNFKYDEALCYRDLGYIIDAISIDLITNGTWQSINSGKSFYKSASARTITFGGSHYTQSVDGIQFATALGLQVLNKEINVRFQSEVPQITTFSNLNQLPSTLINVTGNILATITSPAVTKFTSSMKLITDIIQYGISVAPEPSFGTGLWHICVSNGGNPYVEQGAPLNNDLFPSKIVVGVGSTLVTASNAHGSIVKYVSNTDTSGTNTLLSNVDTLQLQLTTPNFFAYNEEIEFGEAINELNLTIFVESGIYYEHYPLRIPPNVTLKGDDARRTIVRPIDGVSLSPWRGVFFYRDSVIDGIEIGKVNYTTDYNSSSNHAPAISLNITATLDNTSGSIVITLSNNYQAPLTWIGLVFADNVISNFGSNLTERGRAIVDSVSGNTLNCTVIYPFSTSGVRDAGNWFLFDSQNYGYHYLADPTSSSSAGRNNKELDVFLCNEGVRIVGFTFQGHSGFVMVLDPTGNIRAKSPYIQECTSFSQSSNSKKFTGAQFVDGFAGRLYGKLTTVADNGITVTVTGGAESGLHLRSPQPPCSFYVAGVRYQIDQVLSHTVNTTSAVSGIPAPNGTVVLRLDTTTPYLGSTNIGINIEAGGNRSMLANNLSMFNDLAYGVIVTNGGFSEQVCSFTYYAYTGYWANNGGNIRAVGCSNTFGKYGLRSSGYDVTELPDSVALSNNLVQTARIYKTGSTVGEMVTSSVSIWISDYDYTPNNICEVEIDHTNEGGTVVTYAISVVSTTLTQVNGKTVLVLTLNTSQASSIGSSGLTYPLYHNQLVIIRELQNFKFTGIENVKPTRPSTALQFIDKLDEVYRIGSYNLIDSIGTTLPAHVAILQSDVDISYYKFYTDTALLSTTDSGNATCGSKIGDTKIAIIELDQDNDITIINQLAKGTYIFAWNGRIHRVLSYGTSPVPHLLIDSTPLLDNASNSLSSVTLTFVSTTSGTVAGSQYAVFSFPLGTAPLVDTFLTLTGNARYNGTYKVTASSTTSVTLYYPTGVGSSGTGTITASSNNATGISAPFNTNTSSLLKIGYAANTLAIVTTRISTCRATSHDFCDIGTGSYSTTNIPYSIYGDPSDPRNPTYEVLEQGVGRCFYVSTNQDGIFRVGRFFSVDQGTGTVTFSSRIALTNVQGLGFTRGVVINEFTADSSFANNAADIVPVVSAVRSYIDFRLGITHSGLNLSQSSRIGPGFVALNGTTPLEGNLAAGNNRITGLADPTNDQDAATKYWVSEQVKTVNAVSKLSDIIITTPDLASGQILVYDTVSSKWVNESITGDISFSYNGTTLSALISSNAVTNSKVSASAGIVQSKLLLTAASTRANATNIAQADLGVASFNDKVFVSTNGWISLVSSSSATTGVLLSHLQMIPKGTILGDVSSGSGTANVSSVTPEAVVSAGLGIKHTPFTSTGIMTVTNSGLVANNVYSVTGITSSASASDSGKIIKTGANGEIDVAQLKIDQYKIIDTAVSNEASPETTKVVFTTPGAVNFMTAVGNGTELSPVVVSIPGRLEVSNNLVASTLTPPTGVSGTILGEWNVPAGSKLTGNITTSGESLTASSLRPKIKPALLLDFANSRLLDPKIVFTRNSIATYTNTNGVMKTAVANQPRFEYDSSTGICMGLLLEEQRTNRLCYSASFATSGGAQNWTDGSGISRPTSGITAPDGTTAIRFSTTVAGATISISGGVISGPIYRTFSVWLQRISGSGTISITMNNGVNWYTVPITTTLTRYTLTTSTSDNRVAVKLGAVSDSIVMWGAQLEDGAFATSYIPTTIAAVTRQADVAYIDGTNFTRWYRQDEGTLCISHCATATDVSAVVLDYGGASITNGADAVMSIRCYANGSGALLYDAYSSVSSTSQFDFTGLTVSIPSGQSQLNQVVTSSSIVDNTVMHAVTYKTNLATHCYNGTIDTADTSVTVASNMNRLNIGNSAGSQVINKIAYYSKQLSDDEIKIITV